MNNERPQILAGGTAADSIDRTRAAFAAGCAALGPMAPGSRLLLGCSAGGDSMALLELAAERALEKRWTLHVAHFDHAQRPDSAEEARFVAGRCAALKLPFETARLPQGRVFPPGLDEGSLREARYEFFRSCLQRIGAGALVLAHQADDRAETLLMRLLRGSGPTGLGSIRALESIDGMTVVRPLLSLRRADLRVFLTARNLAWLDDPANQDERFKRVWVRHELLPMLGERMGMDMTTRLVRTSELIEEEAGALNEACELMLKQLAAPAPPSSAAALRLDHPLWREAGAPLRRALLRQWIWNLRRGGHPPGFEAVQEAAKFVERAAPGARLRTVERIHLEKSGPLLVAYPAQAASAVDPA